MIESFLKQIIQEPLWYLNIPSEIRDLLYNSENKEEEFLSNRRKLISELGEMLKQDKIPLAKSGDDFDSERKPIDTIVIHHTGDSSTKASDPVAYINALHMIRLYVPEFSNESREYYKTPLWSNHFYEDKMIFAAYHHLIFPDGSSKQILKDGYIGWHCGNWRYNTSSIALCFVDDLEEKIPTDAAIAKAKELIAKYPNCTILGHREIKPTTTCPGGLFLGESGWKRKLLI